MNDGDTLTVSGHRVRLFGIDAPELHQLCTKAGKTWACGLEAKARLSDLIGSHAVTCDPVDWDEYGRIVARCTAAGVDLNRILVATGYAVAFKRYSQDYAEAEEAAKSNRRGIWAGEFEMPSDYRASVRGQAPSSPIRRRAGSLRVSHSPKAVRDEKDCQIKGNRSRRGEWIYHLPGMPYYEQTRAEEMFCTEAQAQAAGYRRSRADRH